MDKDKNSPPLWANKLLEWVCTENELEILQGDLHELYAWRLTSHSRLYANLCFIKDVFDLLIRPFVWKKSKSEYKKSYAGIYVNYLKVGTRSLLKHKGHASINIAGLSLGLACFILISLYIRDEWSYDRYHEHSDDIYRLTVREIDQQGEIIGRYSYVSPQQAVMLKENFPEVVAPVRFYPWNFPVITYDDKEFQENDFVFVEQSVFEVFSFNFLEGSVSQALTEPNSVVLTESSARKYFEEDQAVGKVIQYRGFAGDMRLLKVTGVVEDFPEQSHMSYSFMGSFATIEKSNPQEDFNDYIGNYNFPSYVRLTSGTDLKSLQSKIPALIDQFVGPIQGKKASDKISIYLQPLTEIHLGIGVPGGAGSTGNIYYVILFSAVGLLILLISCFNYVNMSAAKYQTRLKELGIRKALGAGKRQVAKQFFIESMLLVAIAIMISLIISALSLPLINDFAGKHLTMDILNDAWLISYILTLFITMGLLSGTYPALYMSKFKTVRALNGLIGRSGGRSITKSVLIVFQFTITIALIFGVSVIEKQIQYVDSKDLGYDKENILNFYITPQIVDQLSTFKNSLYEVSDILRATASSRIPTESLGDVNSASMVKDGNTDPLEFKLPFVRVDNDYFDTYDIELIAGRPFSEEFKADDNAYIVNRKAIDMMGWKTPEEAIGHALSYGDQQGRITGVVDNFNFESMHSEIQPLIFLNSPKYKRLSVRLSGQNTEETIRHIETVYKKYVPERDFYYSFLDSTYQTLYKDERKLSAIVKVFSGLAIIVACLGLLGLMSFRVEQRFKEITIRKVLGASTKSILLLINRQYFLLIFIAFLLAIPLSYYFINDWLSTFAYRTGIGIDLVILSVVLTTIFALVTISYQSLRAATSNPVDNLKEQ